MKKITTFDLFWSLPIPMLLGIIFGFTFDFKIGLLIGVYSYFNELRTENHKDTIVELEKRIKLLEDGKQG